MSDSNTKSRSAGKWLTSAIVLAIIAGALYYFYISFLQNPCGVTVQYSIGNVDSRFKISKTDALAVSKDAADRWNSQTGSTVLTYDPDAKLKINLIYDERQAKIDKISSEVGTLDSSGNAIDSLRSRIEGLISQYQKDLESYNATVKNWNSKGGAPAGEFERLSSEQQDLEKRRISINKSADLLSKQIDQHNSNLDQVNGEISNEKDKIITQGLYYPSDKKIDIFTFGNKEELRLVVMHELGHALTLGHDTIEQSMLYPILGSQNLADPTLTSEDLQMFATNCSSISGALKNLIQSFQTSLNQSIN